MRLPFRGLAAALALTLLPAAAAAQPLGFDDLPVGQPVTPLAPPTFEDAQPYGGLELAGFFVGSDATVAGIGAGASSGTQFGYIGNGTGVGEIFNPSSTFNFFSGFVGLRAGEGTTTGTVTLRGFDTLGNEVFTQALTVDTTGTIFSVLLPPVDALEFDTSALDALNAGAVLVVDDVTVSTVPEPATVVLLASGLLAVGGMARIRHRRAA